MSDQTASTSSIPPESTVGADEIDRLEELDEAEAAQDAQAETDLDLEAPEADAAEQHLELLQHRDEPIIVRPTEEADPADAAEQRRVVELDEDDYR